MMRPMLRRLYLRSFRSVASAEIELENPTFLIGRNGAGKSNLVDALAFLAELMSNQLSAVFDRRGGIGAVRNRRPGQRRPPNMTFKIELANLDSETATASYAFELRALKGFAFEVVQEQCILASRSDSERAWFDRGRDGRVRTSLGEVSLHMKPAALALPLIGGDTRFQPFVNFLSEMRVYRIDPALLSQGQEPDSGARLHPDGRNIASVLREIRTDSPDEYRRVLELLEKIVPNTVDVRPKPYGNRLALEFTQKWSDQGQLKFESHSVSDGTLRALGLLAAVFQRPTPTVLVIEEPEATIHPGAFGSVLDLLRHATRFTQLIATTHSPDLLDAKWIEDRHLRIVSAEGGPTQVAEVSEDTRSILRDHLMGAGELLRSNALRSSNETHSASSNLRSRSLFHSLER